eukprot:546607_1
MKRKCPSGQQPVVKKRKIQLKLTYFSANNQSQTIDKSQLITDYLSKFRLNEFKDDQEEIITNASNGNNVFISKPTGFGKSLCYQICILVRNKIINNGNKHSASIGLVISPLLSLMKDQVDKLQKIGINAEYVDASVEKKKKMTRIANDIKHGKIDILYVTPESLLSRSSTNKIIFNIKSFRFVSTLVIDEAHCIKLWGILFRPSYCRISDFIYKTCPTATIIPCTSTVPPSDLIYIKNNLNIGNCKIYSASANRPNISLNVKIVTDKKTAFAQAVKQIINTIKRFPNGGIIVYGGTIPTVKKFYKHLIENKVSNINTYYSEMESKEKEIALSDFMNGKCTVIVCTTAFGMGIDKPNVRTVIHLAIPVSIESYFQQVGRAGRDGKLSAAYLFTYEKDNFAAIALRNISYESVMKLARFLFKYYNVQGSAIGTSGDVYRKTQGIKSNITNFGTSLKLLQRFGIIHRGGNSIYLLNKNIQLIDKEEVKLTHGNCKRCIDEIKGMVYSTVCIRKYVLQYFGERYESSDKLTCNKYCCSNCNKRI